MVKRLENWPRLFASYLAARKTMPFQWAVNDCMAFVAHGVGAVTGKDFFSKYSGYLDKAGADKIIASHGGMIQILDAELGPHHRNYRLAHRADVVLLKENDEMIAGLVDENGEKIVCISDIGQIKIPLNQALMIWSY